MQKQKLFSVHFIKYAPDPLNRDTIIIGFFLRDENGKVLSAKFTENWKRLEFIDLNADIPMLRRFASEVSAKAENDEGANELLVEMENGFSNQLQISPGNTFSAESASTIELQLIEEHLKRPVPSCE